MLTCSPRPGNKGLEATLTFQRASATVTIAWPVTAAAQCAQALRELLR